MFETVSRMLDQCLEASAITGANGVSRDAVFRIKQDLCPVGTLSGGVNADAA